MSFKRLENATKKILLFIMNLKFDFDFMSITWNTMLMFLLMLIFPVFPSCSLPVLQDIILRAFSLAQFFLLFVKVHHKTRNG